MTVEPKGISGFVGFLIFSLFTFRGAYMDMPTFPNTQPRLHQSIYNSTTHLPNPQSSCNIPHPIPPQKKEKKTSTVFQRLKDEVDALGLNLVVFLPMASMPQNQGKMPPKKPFFIWQQQTSGNKIHLENQQNSHLAIQMIAICKLKIILATKLICFPMLSLPRFLSKLAASHLQRRPYRGQTSRENS